MSLADWDDELQAVEREIAKVRETHSRARMTGQKALLAKKVAIIQNQIHVDRHLERIKKLTLRDFMLMPRERTMLHWGGLYLEAASKMFTLRNKVKARQLWLRLIKARVAGPETTRHGDIEGDDLVTLAMRQAHLAKTETYLAETLVKLKRRKKDLTSRYESLNIVEENRSASGSLGTRLGTSPEDAFASPTVKALETYVLRMTAPIVAPPAAKRFLDSQERAIGKSDGLFGLCKNVVLSRLNDPNAKPEQRVHDKFQFAMQQLDDLEAETREAWDRILGATPAPAKPKLTPSVT